MAITTERQPYRILFQFAANGTIAGGDIGYNVVVKDGDAILNTIPEPVKMIGIGGWQGVDIAEVSAIINTALAEQNADLSLHLMALENEKEQLQTELTNTQQQNTLQASEIERLKLANKDLTESVSATLLTVDKLKKAIGDAGKLEDLEAVKALLTDALKSETVTTEPTE